MQLVYYKVSTLSDFRKCPYHYYSMTALHNIIIFCFHTFTIHWIKYTELNPILYILVYMIIFLAITNEQGSWPWRGDGKKARFRKGNDCREGHLRLNACCALMAIAEAHTPFVLSLNTHLHLLLQKCLLWLIPTSWSSCKLSDALKQGSPTSRVAAQYRATRTQNYSKCDPTLLCVSPLRSNIQKTDAKCVPLHHN